MNKLLLIPIIAGSVIVSVGTALVVLGVIGNATNKVVYNEYSLQEFKNVNVDLSTSDLTFKVSEDGSSKIVLKERKKYFHDVKISDNTLNIKQVDKRLWFEKFSVFGYDLNATVYLPASELNDCVINTSTGNVTIPHDFSFNSFTANLSTGDVNLKSNVADFVNIKTSTGDISYSGATAKNVELKATTGKVSLDNVKADELIKVETSTGGISLQDSKAKNLAVKASTGSVKLANTVIEEHIDIQTSTGSVKFEDSDGDTLKIKTSTGSVRGTLLTKKIFYVKTDTGTVNVPVSTEGGLCEITTTTGSVNIQIKQ